MFLLASFTLTLHKNNDDSLSSLKNQEFDISCIQQSAFSRSYKLFR